ncbi:SLBB domain-containing protein [Sandarakinorhabdus sp.]|uniref:SLBB domain-containing protein n=1 Tax=Sandarakinorhabdus sp. TaxID=1916663 RepID=UPI0035641675
MSVPSLAQQERTENRNNPPAFGSVAGNDQSQSDRSDGDRRNSRNGPVVKQVELEPKTDAEREAAALREVTVAPMLKPIEPSEFEKFVEAALGRKLPRFGSNLLLPEARDFTVSANTTIPPDYVLGPGDTVEINLLGSISGNFSAEIDSDGRFFVPQIGPVQLAGVRYGDLRARMAAAVSRQFRNFTVSASVKQLRGIQVYVTGFAARPGAYTLNSLATMVNAVLAAGGPSAGGSFRRATLMRGGRMVAELDLYDLLLRGDRSRDSVLQNQDVINLAPLGEQAAMIGSVNSEAIYEVKPGESLEALLALAGGPGVLADTSRLILFRTRDSEALIGREVPRREASSVAAVGGDIVSVLSGGSLQQPQNRQSVLVRLEGEVAKPGNYLVKPRARLGDLLEQAGGLTNQAFVYGTRLERLSVKLQQRAGFQEAVAQLELALAATPLTSSNLNVGEEARSLSAAQAVLARLRVADPDGRLVMDIPPEAGELPNSLVLENNDHIVVPPRPSAVGVFGAVYRPASFLLSGATGLRVSDYVARAGGPIRAADAGRLFVVRANGEVLTRQMGALKAIVLPGDVIFMPVKTSNNNLLAKIRDISSIIFQLGITTAAVVALTR